MEKTLKHWIDDVLTEGGANGLSWSYMLAPLCAGPTPSASAFQALLQPSLSLSAASDSWTSAVSGDWSNGAYWSTGAPPSESTNATIAAVGSYTTMITTSAVADSLLVNDAGAQVLDTGTLTVGTTLSVIAGTFTIDTGGSIAGGTISTRSGGVFLADGGTLDGVTYQGTLSVGASEALVVIGGLELAGIGGGGAGLVSLAGGALLDVLDSETLNNATLTFTGSNGTLQSSYINSNNLATLTFGTSLTILQSSGGHNFIQTAYDDSGQGDTITNGGTLSVISGELTIIGDYADTEGIFVNAGNVNVSGGEFQLFNINFTNTGSLDITGGILDLYETSLTFGAAGNIATTQGGVIIDDVEGSLLGTINGSTTNVEFAGGSLVGVTWKGLLSIGNSGSVSVSRGLTLTGSGALALGSGATMDLAGGLTGVTTYSLLSFAVLDVQDAETLNNGTLAFTGTNGTLQSGAAYVNNHAELTFGSNFTILQSFGRNDLETSYWAGGSMTNDGTISITGGELTAYGDNPSGLLTNGGDILVNDGELQLLFINVINTGSIAISGSGTLDVDYGSSLTFGAGGTISTTGNGEIIDAGSLLGNINARTTNIDFYYGSLVGVIWQGPFLLGASQTVSVSNGLTLTDGSALALGSGATMDLAGGLTGVTTISVASNALLAVEDTGGTLNQGTLTFNGSGAALQCGSIDSTFPDTLTLGSNFTILQSSSSSHDYLTDTYNTYFGFRQANTITNDGTISVTGGELSVNGSALVVGVFSNEGIIQAGNGDFEMNSMTLINISGGTLTSGTYEADANSLIQLQSASVITSDAATLILSGAKSVIEVRDTTNDSYVSVDSSLNFIASTGRLELLAGRIFNAPGTLTDNGALQLGAGTLTAGSGVTISSTGALSGFGRLKSTVTDSGTITASGGNLVIAGAVSGFGVLAAAAEATLDLSAGGTLSQAISGTGTLELGGTYVLGSAPLTVSTILVAANASLSGSGSVMSAVDVLGKVQASTGTLSLVGALSGSGTLSAFAGAELAIAQGGTFTGALAGAGTVEIAADTTLNAGAILSATDIMETANLTLGIGENISNAAGDSFVIAALSGSTVILAGAIGDTLINAGNITAKGTGTVDVSATFRNSGTASVSAGTLAFLGIVTNNGSFSASAGTALFDKDIGGYGTLSIGSTGTLSLLLGSAAGQTVDFLATAGALDLTAPLDFLGTIASFGVNDKIDLIDTVGTTSEYTSGVLKILDGTEVDAILHFTGSYALSDFSLTSDGHGGSFITFS